MINSNGEQLMDNQPHAKWLNDQGGYVSDSSCEKPDIGDETMTLQESHRAMDHGRFQRLERYWISLQNCQLLRKRHKSWAQCTPLILMSQQRLYIRDISMISWYLKAKVLYSIWNAKRHGRGLCAHPCPTPSRKSFATNVMHCSWNFWICTTTNPRVMFYLLTLWNSWWWTPAHGNPPNGWASHVAMVMAIVKNSDNNKY